jgi:hypothetical protein
VGMPVRFDLEDDWKMPKRFRAVDVEDAK